MRKAGGIIALIAGIFAVMAALFTLVIGGAAKAFEASNADLVVYLGWGGVIFSFLTIVLGAICMNATSRWPGILLILCALAGAVLGGTFVALFMVLALVGGIISLFGKRPVPALSTLAAAGLALLLSTAAETEAQDIKSMQLAHELGTALASEEPCGLAYDQAAIAAFIEKRVRADDMAFSGQLQLQTAGVGYQLKSLSASARIAHCTQARRVAKSYGFVR